MIFYLDGGYTLCIFFILIQLSGKIFCQMGRNLGDECIPGMCNSINSNCKWNGTLFKCVCREKYLLINQTHCGKPLATIEETKCQECMLKESLCVDFDNDGLTDECWFPIIKSNTHATPTFKYTILKHFHYFSRLIS